MKNLNNIVYKTSYSVLKKLDSIKDTSRAKAILAKMRSSNDSNISNNIETIAFIFSNVPEEYLGNSDKLSYQEEATLTAVQLYAIHQQAKPNSVLKLDYEEDERKQNIGEALSILRSADSESIDRRFNAMITSSNFKELKHHLIQLIKILKAKSDVKVDYAKLADDLYWYLMGQKDKIKLQWSRSYYKFRKNEKMEGEIQNEE